MRSIGLTSALLCRRGGQGLRLAGPMRTEENCPAGVQDVGGVGLGAQRAVQGAVRIVHRDAEREAVEAA
jgi:hypothetical protein